MAVKEKLGVQVKQLSMCLPDMEGEVANGSETVTDLSMAAGKCAKDVAYERDGLKARLQQLFCGQDRASESITSI